MKIRIMPSSRVSSLSPGRIALGYAVIAILWIAFSDAVVTHLKLHPVCEDDQGDCLCLRDRLAAVFHHQAISPGRSANLVKNVMKPQTCIGQWFRPVMKVFAFWMNLDGFPFGSS